MLLILDLPRSVPTVFFPAVGVRAVLIKLFFFFFCYDFFLSLPYLFFFWFRDGRQGRSLPPLPEWSLFEISCFFFPWLFLSHLGASLISFK